MNVKVRVTSKLLDEVRLDLSRPHAFAAERVGFLFGRLADAGATSRLVLITGYEPVADDRYIDDPRSGARIDGGAIRNAMQGVLDRSQGGFHVHMHRWPGHPCLSQMDVEEIPAVVTALRRVRPTLAHGIVLLHSDEIAAWVWLPESHGFLKADSVTTVGAPLRLFKRDEA
jgi:hypothetical protein